MCGYTSTGMRENYFVHSDVSRTCAVWAESITGGTFAFTYVRVNSILRVRNFVTLLLYEIAHFNDIEHYNATNEY